MPSELVIERPRTSAHELFEPIGSLAVDSDLHATKIGFDIAQRAEDPMITYISGLVAEENYDPLAGDKLEAQALTKSVKRELSSFRGRVDSIRSLSEVQIDNFNTWLTDNAPKYFTDQVPDSAVTESGKDWMRWLGTPEIYDDELTSATDLQVLNFLQWHKSHIEKINADPETQERIASIRQRYQNGIQKMYEMGYVGLPALQRAQVLDKVPVVVGDIFTTYLRPQVTLGYCSRLYTYDEQGDIKTKHAREIVLGPDFDEHTLMHEFGHGDIGSLDSKAFDEFVTEFVATMIDSEGVGDEDFAFEHMPYYREYAMMAQSIIAASRGKIDVRDFTLSWASRSGNMLNKLIRKTYLLPDDIGDYPEMNLLENMFNSFYQEALQTDSDQDPLTLASARFKKALENISREPIVEA